MQRKAKLRRPELATTITDSRRKISNNLDLVAPLTFLIPTSSDESADFAIERLIKLMHAIKRVINDTARKIITRVLFP